jgi:hypothetical protein
VTFLTRLFGKTTPPARTRICVECGMPPANHKDWCAIYRAQLEMKARTGEKDTATNG